VLSWPNRLFLVESAVVMHGLAMLLRVFSLQRVYAMLASSVPRTRHARLSADQMESARSAAPLIDAVSRHGIVPTTCLHRSLALWWLLRRRGVGARLRLGARRSDGVFDGHAWVELEGTVLNDREGVTDEYVPLPWLLSGHDA
jgi:hypothetical protein